jgi:hypothetical protein
MELSARHAFTSPLLVIVVPSLLFAPVTAFGANSLDGIWRSQGYGYVFNFRLSSQGLRGNTDYLHARIHGDSFPYNWARPRS